MTLYPYIKLLCDTTLFFRCPFAKYFVFVFSKINFLPYYISATIRYTHSLFKSHFSEKTKNILFFAIVLQILLFISGTVETNPGPDTSKKNNLSFAVWNLDSLPARDFARIPLIETLQATYDFDMFGVCESMLTGNISNEDILINGFHPIPLGLTKLLISEMGAFVYISRNPYPSRIDVT